MSTRRPLCLVAIVLASSNACTAGRPDQALRAATGSVSHQLCSAAFVSRVDPDRFFAESLAPEPGIWLISPALDYDVDPDAREVRSTIAGGFASRAVDRDVAGCVLVHDAPGKDWRYSDGGYAILARIVRDRVGGRAEDVLRFAHDELLAPLGAYDVTIELDSTGTPIGSRAILASARDWTRFGQLYLDDGLAGARRILPEGWVAYSTTPSLGQGYGAGFWLNSTHAEMPVWGLHWGMPHAPRDAFFARGYLGQYMVVVPAARLVIARFGISHGRGHDVELVGKLVADVIDALGGASEDGVEPRVTGNQWRDRPCDGRF